MYSKHDRKLVTVNYNGPIIELGSICGPISTPSQLTIDAISRLVLNKKEVWEYNPNNKREKVRLTLSNLNKDNFNKKKDEVSLNTSADEQSVKEEVKEIDSKDVSGATSENVIEEVESSLHEELVESKAEIIEAEIEAEEDLTAIEPDEIGKDDEDTQDIMNSSEQNEDVQIPVENKKQNYNRKNKKNRK